MVELTRLLVLAGYQRSGTTWLSNLINSSPEVIYRHEFFGRLWAKLPPELWQKLKQNHGITEVERHTVLETALTAHHEADRPPFFDKDHLVLSNPRLHHLMWMATNVLPKLLSPLYRTLYQPRGRGSLLLIKETRSAVNLDSILAGLAPDLSLFVFRHPCGAIASHLRGIASGRMQPPTAKQLKVFHAHNQSSLRSLAVEPSLEGWMQEPIERQLAAMWVAQNQRYLEMGKSITSIYLDYEAFYAARQQATPLLLQAIGISFTEQTGEFLNGSPTNRQSLLSRDSSSEFFSVYRQQNFDPLGWQKQLTEAQVEAIMAVAAPAYETLQQRAWDCQVPPVPAIEAAQPLN